MREGGAHGWYYNVFGVDAVFEAGTAEPVLLEVNVYPAIAGGTMVRRAAGLLLLIRYLIDEFSHNAVPMGRRCESEGRQQQQQKQKQQRQQQQQQQQQQQHLQQQQQQQQQRQRQQQRQQAQQQQAQQQVQQQQAQKQAQKDRSLVPPTALVVFGQCRCAPHSRDGSTLSNPPTWHLFGCVWLLVSPYSTGRRRL